MGCIRMWTLRKRIDQMRNSNQADLSGTECASAMNEPLTPAASHGHKVRASRGQSLVEMALVLPMFLMLLCGVVDFSNVFYTEMTVQNALRQAGRFATTGNHLADPNNPGNNLTRVNSIIATAQQAAPGFNFNSISISSVNGGAGSAGGPGDIVTISITTGVQMLTPIIAPFFKPNGKYNFTVSVTFKNEPFPANQTT